MIEEREIEWKKTMNDILNSVGIEVDYKDAFTIYNKLVDVHKEIFGEDHDKYWTLGMSRDQLNTYLLIRIFSMLKHTKEVKELD